MRVHHLDCASMRPPLVPEGIVCHVLLIETAAGPVLVDTGFGQADIDRPARIGPARFALRPVLDTTQTAAAQVRAHGWQPSDVAHIVLTHFDIDHAGGLADFPNAAVHVVDAEAEAVAHPPTILERNRYRGDLSAHGPRIVGHPVGRGDPWFGFPRVTELSEIAPGLLLVALPGHTRGHAAVAVDTGDGWLLHAGDAFYHRSQIDGTGHAPLALRIVERSMAVDWTTVRANHERLAELWRRDDPSLRIVNAHDPALLAAARARTNPEHPNP